MATVDTRPGQSGGLMDGHGHEDLSDGMNGNPLPDDGNSVVEHSIASGSDPLDADDYCSPGELESDDEIITPPKNRAEARRSNYKAKSEGMSGLQGLDSELMNESIYSPVVMGSGDGAGIRDSQYFEMEYARREAENQVEQLKLQLKGKNSQLEQVQMVLMSYEEEIMKLRKNGMGTIAESDNEEDEAVYDGEEDPRGVGSGPEEVLGIAEDLSRKIVLLQTNVQDLEEEMVRVKLENAQLRETNEFLKNAVQKANRRESFRSLRNPFARQ